MGKDLAARVSENAKQVESGNTPPPLVTQIQRMREQFALAAPKGVEAAQLVRDSLTMLRQNPRLAECEPMSVLGGLMTMAQLGLRPGVLGHGWLIPFRNHGKMQAQLVIGYQGLVELAHRSGRVSSLIARAVHENDTFEIDYGLRDNLSHKPPIKGERGEVIGYYAFVRFGNPDGHAFFYMTREEVAQHRDRFAMARDRNGNIVGPWRDHFDAMALKTVVRQLAKWMPKATDLATAMVVDESIRVDLDPDADPVHESQRPTIEVQPAEGRDVPAGADDDAWAKHEQEIAARDAELDLGTEA